MVRKKEKEKKVEEDATNPRLKWSLVVSDAGVKVFMSGKGSLSDTELIALNKGEIKFYLNWEDFSDCSFNTIRSLAMQFKVEFPTAKNKTEASLIVWAKMCEVGTPSYMVATTKKKGKLVNRVYRRAVLTPREEKMRGDANALCPQAKACLDIFMSAGLDEIPEARMRQIVEEQADKLRTRQDPWRIWQYYRPQLIGARWITLN